MASRIEEMIDEIEEYIENCKPQALSASKIIVNKDEIEELLSELRAKTPDEIRRYQKIINNKDAILADAQAKANKIIEDAQIQKSDLISEHQIMQQAYAQANEVITIATNQAQEILDKATEDANNYRTAAMEYTDNLLENLQGIISSSIESTSAKYDSLLSTLRECQTTVNANRAELHPEQQVPVDDGTEAEDDKKEEKQDEINVIPS